MTNSAKTYNRFENFAQRIWNEPTLEGKKHLMLTLVIPNFEFKSKKHKISEQVKNTHNPTQIDKLIADLVLLQSGDRVIN